MTAMLMALLFAAPAASAAQQPAWIKLYQDYLATLTKLEQTQAALTPSPTATPAQTSTPTPDPPAAATIAPTATQTPAPTPTPKPQDTYIRCFLMLADLDRDSVPELLYGYREPSNSEIRVQVLCIVDNQVVKAAGPVIPAAYSLKMAELTLFQTVNGYFWMFESGGSETLGGRRQVRYTQLTYKNGNIKSLNRFTRRWTSTDPEYYVDGDVVSSVTYKNKFKLYQNSIKPVQKMPQAKLGSATANPTPAQIMSAFKALVPKYQKIAVPKKMKLSGKYQILRLGAKDKAKLLMLSRYASATRGTVTWTSSDPDVITVDTKGNVEAVGYGSATITATLMSGKSAKSKLSVERPKVTKMKIVAESNRMKDGEQMQLFCVLSPMTAREELIWKSSNPSVATVDEKTGLVTAMRAGNVRIGCWVNKKVRTGYNLTITSGNWISEVALQANKTAITVGERTAVTYQISPENAVRQDLNWQSDNPSVATVTQGGVVTGMGVGTATITASTGLSGVKGAVQVSVSAGAGYQKGAAVADGVYQISLRTEGQRALTVRAFSALQRAPITIAPNSGGANQRFLVRCARDDLYEIRPLCAPMMYLSVRADPIDSKKGERLALALMPTERERLFRLNRLANGGYALSLASNAQITIGALRDEDGATVNATQYDENNALRRFQLTLLSEPGKLEPLPTPVPTATPNPKQTPDPSATLSPTPAPTAQAPRELDWLKNLRSFLSAHEADMLKWSHLQLCDMDFSGIPELVIFTDKREKPVMSSLTARTGYIYSPETGDSTLARFEYEPGPNESLKDTKPTVRLLIDGATSERLWVLTDGEGTDSRGSQRYVLMPYAGGAVQQRLLFKKTWRPRNASGEPYETYFYNAKECSKYIYERQFQSYFKGSVWGNSVKAMLECSGRSVSQVMADVVVLAQTRRWYS